MNRIGQLVLLTSLLALVAGLPVQAVDRFVPTGGSPSYATIQDAIDACNPSGDRVLVVPGSYVGAGFTDLLISGIQVSFLPSTTGRVELNCEDITGRRALASTPGSHVIFTDFDFTAGHANQGGAIQADDSDLDLTDCVFQLNHTTISTGDRMGGALYITGNGFLNIDGCLFNSNYLLQSSSSASGYGGAIYARQLVAITIVDTYFYDNHDDGVYESRGGAMYIDSPTPVQTYVSVSGSYFWDNYLTSNAGAMGGAIFFNDWVEVHLDEVEFQGNYLETETTSGYYGGAIATDGIFNSQIEILGSTFLQNEAAVEPDGDLRLLGFGGAIALLSPGTIEIQDSRFEENRAAHGAGLWLEEPLTHTTTLELRECALWENAGWEGAGLQLIGGAHILTNCLLVKNEALSATFGDGGAILLSDGATLAMHSCTLSRNESENSGAGLFLDTAAPGQVTVTNSIIWDNLCGEVDPNLCQIDGTATVSYSDLQRSSGTWPGTGNVNQDPILTWWFRINSSFSPCVDTGTTTGAPSTDIDGDSRPWPSVGGAFDMGCDEWTGSVPSPPAVVPSTGPAGLILLALVLGGWMGLRRRR